VTVTDGPFTESKELISYALYDLRSREEAIEWARPAPSSPAPRRSPATNANVPCSSPAPPSASPVGSRLASG
jgi:hypothetical protein